MIIECPICGKRNPDGTAYCQKCGTWLVDKGIAKQPRIKRLLLIIGALAAIAAIISVVIVLTPELREMVGLTEEDTLVSTVQPTQTPVAPPLPAIPLTELPERIQEEFQSAFYSDCEPPDFETLRIKMGRSGRGSAQVEYNSPEGRYFLVLVATPSDENGEDWFFDGLLQTSSGEKYRSLTLTSKVPLVLSDAELRCGGVMGSPLLDILGISSKNLAWNVFIVSSDGEEELPTNVGQAVLNGYYTCPPMPPLEDWEVTELGSGEGSAELQFLDTPPHSVLGVQFSPAKEIWWFRSLNIGGDREMLGPIVNTTTGETIDFQAWCLESSAPGHLEIDSDGGIWTVYLFTVRAN